MPAKITRMKDQPVVVAFLTGEISHDDIITITEQTRRLVPNEQRFYRIMDVREAKVRSRDALNDLITSDGRMMAAIVGSDDLAVHNVPVFADMDDALNYVREINTHS
jgi:hypothetical protein